jgi:hypothetical protein
MFEETAEHSELHSEPGSESQSGCGSQHGTPVAIDETAASEQALNDERVRARNKAVRDHHKAPQAGVVPPFSNHSGSL